MRRILLWLALLVPTLTPAADWLYLTYPGDTLSQIGVKYLKNWRDWPKVMALNKIPHDRVLPVNTRIRIPVELMRADPAPAVVTHVTGNVRVKPADGPFRPLAVGERISGGETVLTGPRSFASFRLADASVINQQPSTRLVFGRLAAYGDTGMVSTELDLQDGRLEANASRQVAPGGGFQVKTPIAVAGLRGTAFRLNMDAEGKALRSEVLEGAVGVTAQRKEVVVPAGQGTIAEAGRPPAAARPLLPAPEVIALPNRIRSLPIRFSWQRDDAARAWRAQIAADAAFSQVLLEALTERPAVQWEDALPDGRYYLRLRAVDADGLEGLDRDHPFELDLRPLPPQLISPAEGQRSYDGNVTFTWAIPEEAHGFVLQRSPSSHFGRDVEEVRLDAVGRHVAQVPPGTWYWRMASLSDKGERHLWGPPQSFLVRPLPAAPTTGEVRTEAGQAHLAWLPVAGAERYELALGKRADFKAALLQQTTDATRATLPLKAGRYYWRVRGLEADGQAGAWSQASPLVMPPAAPTALQARIEGDALLLQWQGEGPAYRVELATDPAFGQIVSRLDAPGPQARLPKPQPGQYWLRVLAVGDDGVESAPSPSSMLEVHRLVPWWLIPLFLVPMGG
jgi:hypothetical protein